MLGTDGRLYDSSFDFDEDGELDAYEYAVIDDIVFGHDEDEDEEEDSYEESLSERWDYMDDDEKREALEDAGIDYDDCDLDDFDEFDLE